MVLDISFPGFLEDLLRYTLYSSFLFYNQYRIFYMCNQINSSSSSSITDILFKQHICISLCILYIYTNNRVYTLYTVIPSQRVTITLTQHITNNRLWPSTIHKQSHSHAALLLHLWVGLLRGETITDFCSGFPTLTSNNTASWLQRTLVLIMPWC